MEICEYVDELMYPEGGVNKLGEKTQMIKLPNGEMVYGSPSGKSIWIVVRKRYGNQTKELKFSIPVSQMINPRLATVRGKKCIQFRMIKGLYYHCTFGKKRKDGTPMFPKRNSIRTLTERLDKIQGITTTTSAKPSYSGATSLK